MTDGQKKPIDPSDDDWAMSEPDPELKGEELEITSPPEELNEQVSSLYDPLHTDELEGWDINTAELPETAAEEPVAAAEQSLDGEFADHEPADEIQADDIDIEPEISQPTFHTPQNTFEIIEPEKTSIQQESWEMGSAPAPGGPDSWKMPEPEFRCSEGVLAEEVSKRVGANSAQPQVIDEQLSGIYAPPDTVEVVDESSESIDVASVPMDENFDAEEIPEEFEEEFVEEFELDEDEESIETEEVKEKSKGKAFIFLGVGVLLISIVVAALLVAAYFFYYQTN